MNIRQAVTFVILMSNNRGIIDKHPSYLLEKLRACEGRVAPEQILDSGNMAIFDEYKSKYGFNWNEGKDYWDIPMDEFDKITGEPLVNKKK